MKIRRLIFMMLVGLLCFGTVMVGCSSDGGTNDVNGEDEDPSNSNIGIREIYRGNYTTEDRLWTITLGEKTVTLIDNTSKTSEVLSSDAYMNMTTMDICQYPKGTQIFRISAGGGILSFFYQGKRYYKE